MMTGISIFLQLALVRGCERVSVCVHLCVHAYNIVSVIGLDVGLASGGT